MDKNSEPDISVLIATRDRAGYLKKTLESLEGQNLRGLRCEVIVVDNGSRDTTDRLLSSWHSDLFDFRPLRFDQAGKSRALNFGLGSVRGELVVFTDDDVIASTCWLYSLWSAYQRWHGPYAFGGRICPIFPAGTPAWVRDGRTVWQRENFSAYRFGNIERLVKVAPFGPNMAVAQKWIGDQRFDEKLGPGGDLDINVGEETAFLNNLVERRGLNFVYVPTAQVDHTVRPDQVTVEWLAKRAYNFGRTKGYERYVKDVSSIQFAGLPLYLRLRLLRSHLRIHLMRWVSERRRYIHCWKRSVRVGHASMYRDLCISRNPAKRSGANASSLD